MHQESLMQRGDFPIPLVLLKTALTMEPNHVGYTLHCPCTASFQTLLVSAFSVTYPRRNSLEPRDPKRIGLAE